MKTPSLALMALILLTVGGCASRPAASPGPSTRNAREQRQMLFGWWVARRSAPHGETVVTVTLRCPDGVYLKDVRTLDRGGKLRNEHQGVGDWGISGPVYFTIEHERRGPGEKHRQLDMTRERNYTAYRILRLSYTSFKYRSWSGGTVIDAHRASPDELSQLNDQTGAMQLPASCGGSDD